jgi:hypothetical protein
MITHWKDMLNPYLNDWVLRTSGLFPEENVPVIILVEHDVIYDADEEFPFTRKAELIKTKIVSTLDDTVLAWKLLDYDPETEDELLQQCFTVIAWRYFSPKKDSK